MIIHSLILLLFVSVVPIDSLVCYDCGCDQTDLSQCACGSITTDVDDYCIIIEGLYVSETYITLGRIPRNASWLFVDDPYFILAIESIRYNETTTDWSLWTYSILYGCDWDYCNSPTLINVLPDSFVLSINTNWLNTNIYGSGSTNSCHYCPEGDCGTVDNPFNSSQCPLTSCTNATSCLAFDLWTDLNTGEQCYYADCAPGYLDGPDAEFYGGKHKIDIEAIVYLAQNRSTYEIWEIDVYCAAFNCTRSTIFEEVQQQLSANFSDFSAFPIVRPTTIVPPITTTPIPNPLTCYYCDCIDTPTCPCDTTVVTSITDAYCILVRENYGQFTFVYSYYLEYTQIDQFINEFPYALVEESISYDERGGLWYTTTNLVVYGCNWNLCNKPELVPLLPNTFQMRLPEVWLNSSVLGSGLPVRDCHQCPDEAQCGLIDYLDANTCPIQACNTTCLVIDTYDDPTSDYLCYQSYCLPPDPVEFQWERHRIDIEGVVYASQPNVVELWEIDIYCRADNCSSPTIFRELQQQLTVQVGNLAALFNETHDPTIPQRRCYDCYCNNPLNCPCNRTTIVAANSTYCFIVRENYGQDVWIDLGHIDQTSSRLYIRDFPYLLLEETILYSEQTGRWTTITNYVVYGCNWDYCNDPNLIQYLPSSFQMRLPETWLNSSVLGTGLPVRNCHQCPDAPVCSVNSSIDGNLCPVAACNGTCLVFDTFDDPANGLQCYQSYCAPAGSDSADFDRHRIELEGILYLQKQPRSVELWEVDIYCRADDCSRPEIFDELKSQLITEYGDLSGFDRTTTSGTPSTSALPTTTSNVQPTTTSSVQPTTSNVQPTTTSSVQSTTTSNVQPTTTSNASIFTSLNLFIIVLIPIIFFNFIN